VISGFSIDIHIRIPHYFSSFMCVSGLPASAGLTIVANVAIATGAAFLGAPRSSAINLIYYIIYKIFFYLINKYFAKFAVSSKQRFSIEVCLCPEILV